MKNAFDGLIRIILCAQEIIGDLEDMSVKTSQTEKKKDWKKQYSETVG